MVLVVTGWVSAVMTKHGLFVTVHRALPLLLLCLSAFYGLTSQLAHTVYHLKFARILFIVLCGTSSRK